MINRYRLLPLAEDRTFRRRPSLLTIENVLNELEGIDGEVGRREEEFVFIFDASSLSIGTSNELLEEADEVVEG